MLTYRRLVEEMNQRRLRDERRWDYEVGEGEYGLADHYYSTNHLFDLQLSFYCSKKNNKNNVRRRKIVNHGFKPAGSASYDYVQRTKPSQAKNKTHYNNQT